MEQWEVILLAILASVVLLICLSWGLNPLFSGRKAQSRRGRAFARETDVYESALGHRQIESLYEEPTKTISVIVPAYNEQYRLSKMLLNTLKHLEDEKKKLPNFSFEVIVVDDGSVDATADIVLSFAKKAGANSDLIRLCRFCKNRGKGAAVRQGMLSMQGRYGLMADADGACDIRDLRKLTDAMKLIERNGMGISIGSLAHVDDSVKRSLHRRLAMMLFQMCSWLVCKSEIQDTQCGFKLYTRDTAKLIFRDLHLEKWSFDQEVIFLATKLGIPMVEVPIRWTELAGSKLITNKFSSIIKEGITMFRDMCCVSFAYYWGIWRVCDANPEKLRSKYR